MITNRPPPPSVGSISGGEEAPLPSYPIMIRINANQMLVPMRKARPSGVRELVQSQVDTAGCLPDSAPNRPGEAPGFSGKCPSAGLGARDGLPCDSLPWLLQAWANSADSACFLLHWQNAIA